MKKELIHILTVLAGAAMLFACEKQTTPEPVRIPYPVSGQAVAHSA